MRGREVGAAAEAARRAGREGARAFGRGGGAPPDERLELYTIVRAREGAQGDGEPAVARDGGAGARRDPATVEQARPAVLRRTGTQERPRDELHEALRL